MCCKSKSGGFRFTASGSCRTRFPGFSCRPVGAFAWTPPIEFAAGILPWKEEAAADARRLALNRHERHLDHLPVSLTKMTKALEEAAHRPLRLLAEAEVPNSPPNSQHDCRRGPPSSPELPTEKTPDSPPKNQSEGAKGTLWWPSPPTPTPQSSCWRSI